MKDQPYMVGKGHGGNSNLPVIREPNNPQLVALVTRGMLEPGTRQFKMGKVTILLSPPLESVGWHMSISHPDRYPTWDEVAKAWYELVPDSDNRVGKMILPKREDYINIHNFCFQIHEDLNG